MVVLSTIDQSGPQTIFVSGLADPGFQHEGGVGDLFLEEMVA